VRRTITTMTSSRHRLTAGFVQRRNGFWSVE
jgi:hypothetical protein